MYSSSVGRQALLLHVSCSALSVARHPALLIGKIPALLLGFSLVVACHNTSIYRGAAHPLCFTEEVLDHEFPQGFKPVNIEAYDGTTDPGVWIEDFILHIHMARGDDLHAIKYLPLKLKGPARHWLKSLP